MKLLVVGLDGVDLTLINSFDMPFVQGLVKERIAVPVREDLWSRGWVKILSGLPATMTGAFYEQPALNGRPEFTQAFGTHNYPADTQRPLWEVFNNKGIRSGFFNLPTTLPAPAIKGFVISGAGGGFSPGSRIPSEACYPASLQNELIKRRTIWENRFVVSGVRSTDLFFNRCIDAIWNRVDTFCDIIEDNFPIDFGFLVHKESVVITNIFMHDIQALIDGHRPTIATHYLAQQFFGNLDDSIKILVERLQPKRIAILSDHGAKSYRHSLNFNFILRDLEYLSYKKPERPSRFRDNPSLVRIYRRFLRYSTSRIGVAVPPQRFDKAASIDFSKTKAFAHFYVPGIYLNDERFGGPQHSQKRSFELTDAICRDFNDHSVAKQNKLKARPFRREHMGCVADRLLPEIWVDHPEDCFPEQRGLAIQPNPYYRTWDNLQFLDRDIASGKKSSNAMCIFEKDFIDDIDVHDGQPDLTVAYRYIINHFND